MMLKNSVDFRGVAEVPRNFRPLVSLLSCSSAVSATLLPPDSLSLTLAYRNFQRLDADKGSKREKSVVDTQKQMQLEKRDIRTSATALVGFV